MTVDASKAAAAGADGSPTAAAASPAMDASKAAAHAASLGLASDASWDAKERQVAERDAWIHDPEWLRVESWLDEHPDFSLDYFLRSARL